MTKTLANRLTGLLKAAVVSLAVAAGGGAGAEPQGTLRFGTNQQLDDWETLTKANSTYLSLVYESLAEMAPDGVTIRPRLAASWKEGAGKLEITLRDGVTFHNGATLDANDVALSYIVQWDASNPLHVGRDGSFTYFSGLFGSFLNAPPAE